jgi:hypothetical protein
MSVRVDLQSIPVGYFIDRRGALGVMTGQYTLLEYQTAGFSPKPEGFFLEQCLWIAESGSSADFVPRGSCSRSFGSRYLPNAFKENKFHRCKMQRESSQNKRRIQKVLHLLPIFTHP